jgi:Rieske Fe-S protein
VKHERDRARGCACSGSDRRDFLTQATGLVAGVLAGLGASTSEASASPVGLGSPLSAAGADLTYPMPAADGATIDRDNSVIVVRYQGKVYAFNLACPHENAAVRWKGALGRFECSRHDSQYKPDGTYTSGRATRNMDRFNVKKDGATLLVDVSRLIQSDQQKAAWDAAFVAV